MTQGMPDLPDRPPGPGSTLGIAMVAVVLAIDQATKWAAQAWLGLDQTVDILPILALHLTHNTGVAFSMFAGYGSGVLIAVTLAITLLVLIFWVRAKEGGTVAAVGFGLILGGALGNLIDRLIAGHVVDFLLLHIGDRVLFIFNFADVALTLGPLALILAYMRPRRPAGPEAEQTRRGGA